MARNFFGFLAKNKPVWVSGKTKNIPGANWLNKVGTSINYPEKMIPSKVLSSIGKTGTVMSDLQLFGNFM